MAGTNLPDNLHIAVQINNPQLIVPGLLISSFQFETIELQLREQGVTHIVQVGIELGPSHTGKFEYLHVPIQDVEGVDLIAQLPPVFQFMDSALAKGGVVLVHCMMGISRSASTCIAFLMWKQRLPFVRAAEQVYAARPFISPNPGFVLQLRLWEQAGMEFGSWSGWSRQKFLQAVEEGGGLKSCLFDNVMREAGVDLGTLWEQRNSGAFGTVVPSPPPPKRRPMPVRWTHKFCCVS
ncbi:MAP kinase phosphatase 3 [Volvox carteri f. nagariensis]|uniref:MAP kinase phosphatase 3 n=1 Tax=Volvox carteri f. nagariensis TaxID=3068 RepID=D8U983_VOLCA|nr:MAP kinase phosphatase 3 [Volvox carteri f. nagariensis]EFJ43763.1 MAP kinase phosphatase 3 [Volvox carteri f. nagariensis]|eukprot:XP_002955244.1 MAP kinase phosphatase 3 [Volvox carteri f. nagariensis]